MLSQKVDFKLNASSSLCPENIQRTFRMSEVERNVIDTSSIKGIPIIWIMGKTEFFSVITMYSLLNVKIEKKPSIFYWS